MADNATHEVKVWLVGAAEITYQAKDTSYFEAGYAVVAPDEDGIDVWYFHPWHTVEKVEDRNPRWEAGTRASHGH